MADQFRIEGLDDALRTIQRLPDFVAPQGGGPINKALFRAAGIWRDQVQANASGLGPGNHQRGSGSSAMSVVGRLKDNIIRRRDPEPERDGHYARVSVGYRARIYWGAFVENGTEKQSAQPFLRPALDQAGNRPTEIFATALRRDIDRIVKRLRQ